MTQFTVHSIVSNTAAPRWNLQVAGCMMQNVWFPKGDQTVTITTFTNVRSLWFCSGARISTNRSENVVEIVVGWEEMWAVNKLLHSLVWRMPDSAQHVWFAPEITIVTGTKQICMFSHAALEDTTPGIFCKLVNLALPVAKCDVILSQATNASFVRRYRINPAYSKPTFWWSGFTWWCLLWIDGHQCFTKYLEHWQVRASPRTQRYSEWTAYQSAKSRLSRLIFSLV